MYAIMVTVGFNMPGIDWEFLHSTDDMYILDRLHKPHYVTDLSPVGGWKCLPASGSRSK